MKQLIKTILVACAAISLAGCAQTVKMSRDTLTDKIKGGWAGQMFGCIYGGPTEFKWREAMIPDSVSLSLPEGRARWYFEHSEGLYDDIYNDLEFLTVLHEKGIDAPIEVFAEYYKNSGFSLWHANQAGRNNLIAGIGAPASGHWKNNPHADDIDFQIEADFAGLSAPCMPHTALSICDRTGHIMNYGDGYYGGVYVATMYTLAFYYDDIKAVVKDALKAIPEGTQFHGCINDVIAWCGQNEDWKTTWQMVEDKWNNDMGCPEGAGNPYNIDAKINAAYIVMGLLYGNGDMAKTLDISTRCGQDSDCNPASAAGVLGTMLGYSNIGEEFTSNVEDVQDIKFRYPSMSMNDTYAMSESVALEEIKANGGKVSDDDVTIKVQKIECAPYEQCWEGLVYTGRDDSCRRDLNAEPWSYTFEGCGFAIAGYLGRKKDCPKAFANEYVGLVDVTVDGVTKEVRMPCNYRTRALDIYWDYELADGKHDVKVVWKNPDDRISLKLWGILTYSPAE